MKRSITHLFICFALGCAAGSFSGNAIENSSIFYGILAVIAIIALVLHVSRGPGKSDKE